MATNKIVLRTTEEFMSGYKPVYQPLYPLLLGRSQAYSEEVGKINFNRLVAVGDLRAKHQLPKQTEMAQVSVVNSAKSFKKYFLANQYIQSELQASEDIDGIVAQVLDEHQKHMDDLVLLGEGTSASTMINNGLFWSNDPNYTLDSAATIDNAPDTQADFYETFMEALSRSRDVPGSKAIIVYGSTALSKLDSLFPDKSVSLKAAIDGALESNESIIRMPSAVTPSNTNGMIIVSSEVVKLHYTALPKLAAQGVNPEKMYSWHNFLMGSAMVEVEAANGIIRTPFTFES